MAGRKPGDETLRAAVLRRLAVLDDLARHGDADDLLPLARTELHRLADGWRLLLTAHQPGADGRCRVCPSRFRRRRWPCRVWTMAYQHLLGDSVPSVPAARSAAGPATVAAAVAATVVAAGAGAARPPPPGDRSVAFRRRRPDVPVRATRPPPVGQDDRHSPGEDGEDACTTAAAGSRCRA